MTTQALASPLSFLFDLFGNFQTRKAPRNPPTAPQHQDDKAERAYLSEVMYRNPEAFSCDMDMQCIEFLYMRGH